jgi:hypothetical protein
VRLAAGDSLALARITFKDRREGLTKASAGLSLAENLAPAFYVKTTGHSCDICLPLKL